MQHTTKLLPILLLGSALGGCSMAGTGDYFADDYAHIQQTQMPHYYGAAESDCAPAVPVSYDPCGNPAVTPSPHAYGHSVPSHYGQAQYGQNPYGQAAYVPPSYGAAPYGLRGKSTGFEPHLYGTLGVVNYEAGDDLYGAQARVGYQFNKYLGAEAEGSLGISSETDDFITGGVPFEQKIDIDNSAAGFGVLRYPLFGKVSGYSRVGYHETKIAETLTDDAGVSEKTKFSVNGIAYGSGLMYNLNPRTAVRLDYTVYDYDGPDADSLSLAIARKF